MRQNLISRIAEWFCRRLIYARFGRESVEADFITDYLDKEVPDWAGARRAWRTFARLRRDAAARKRRGGAITRS
jgi:hypothetical protein